MSDASVPRRFDRAPDVVDVRHDLFRVCTRQDQEPGGVHISGMS